MLADGASTQPPMVGMQNESSVQYTHCTHVFFARLAPICALSLVIINKFSAVESSWKFIAGSLLVGLQVFNLGDIPVSGTLLCY